MIYCIRLICIDIGGGYPLPVLHYPPSFSTASANESTIFPGLTRKASAISNSRARFGTLRPPSRAEIKPLLTSYGKPSLTGHSLRQKEGCVVGKSKHGKGAKIMAVADAAGFPLVLHMASVSYPNRKALTVFHCKGLIFLEPARRIELLTC